MERIICCIQTAPVWGLPHENLKRAGILIRRAAEAGAELVCLPEQFATGWSPAPPWEPESSDGRTVQTLAKFARECSVAVVGSFLEKHDPRPRNTAVAITPDGRIAGMYSKIHLFSPQGEDRSLAPGRRITVTELCGIRIGLAICYDLRFPSLFRNCAAEGAELMLVQAAWPCSRMEHWEVFIRARALENQFFVAGVNCTGTTPVDHYCGGSMVADPDGRIAARAGSGEELLVCRIEADRVLSAREQLPFWRDQQEGGRGRGAGA